MLGWWDKWLFFQASDVLSIISFIISYRLRALKTLCFYFCKFIKKMKKCIESWKLKPFLQRILQEIMKKNNTWNIKCLVNESFVPVNQGTSILYCRLSDFYLPSLTLQDRECTLWFSDRLDYVSKALLCWLLSVCSDRLPKFLTFQIHILRFKSLSGFQ